MRGEHLPECTRVWAPMHDGGLRVLRAGQEQAQQGRGKTTNFLGQLGFTIFMATVTPVPNSKCTESLNENAPVREVW